MMHLVQTEPFARGGNRVCYVHPDNTDICIKVPRPDVSLAQKRRRKGLKGRIKPASAFDDNSQDARTLTHLHRSIGPSLASVVPRFLGWIDTDVGAGIMVDLIRDAGGAIATPLKQYIWEQGMTPALHCALEQFERYWIDHAVPSRDLLLHNVVVATVPGPCVRLVVIDGLGNSDLLPFARMVPALARRKSTRKVANLRVRIEKLLTTKVDGGDPGEHGFLTPPPSGR